MATLTFNELNHGSDSLPVSHSNVTNFATVYCTIGLFLINLPL